MIEVVAQEELVVFFVIGCVLGDFTSAMTHNDFKIA